MSGKHRKYLQYRNESTWDYLVDREGQDPIMATIERAYTDHLRFRVFSPIVDDFVDEVPNGFENERIEYWISSIIEARILFRR